VPTTALSRLVAGACWLACACADASEPSSEARIHRTYCQASCERQAACDPRRSLSACVSFCAQDPDQGRLNPQVWSGQLGCIAQRDCAALRDASAPDICFEMARAALIPSDACIEFCLEDSARSFECGGGYSVEECVTGRFCAWHDALLAQGALCNASSVGTAPDDPVITDPAASLDVCQTRAMCLASVFGP
jgi:hypothetical protein